MNKIFYALICILIIAGGYYLYSQNFKKVNAPITPAPISENSTEDQGEKAFGTTTTSTETSSKPKENSASAADPAQGTFSNGEEVNSGSDIQVVEVLYDGKNFSPVNLDIKVNDYVFFKNNSSVDFWPASAGHSVQSPYPEFDAKKAIAPGKTFKFQFTKVGAWDYHDHLNPTAMGAVNVK